MTKQALLDNPPVRETRGEYRGRIVVAEIHGAVLVLRLKGTQTRYTVGWADLAESLEMKAAKAEHGDIPPRTIRGRPRKVAGINPADCPMPCENCGNALCCVASLVRGG